jgi:hypothetical protein
MHLSKKVKISQRIAASTNVLHEFFGHTRMRMCVLLNGVWSGSRRRGTAGCWR